MDIKSPSEYFHTVKMRLQINDDEGLAAAQLVLEEDLFMSLDLFSATISYAPDGYLKRLKKKDLMIIPYKIDGSFYSDSKYHIADLKYHKFPYTIDYEYKLHITGYIDIPIWQPVTSHQTVDKSIIKITCPENLQINYRVYNYPFKVNTFQENKTKIITCEYHSDICYIQEELMPHYKSVFPYIDFTPNVFEIDDHTGGLSSWAEFGQFYYDLNKGRQEIPPSLKTKITKIIGGENEPSKIVDILYQYLQTNTRYVNIQLGIDGFQTHTAKYVADNGYGDCKALTNFMQSLLAWQHIQSYPVLIYGGNNYSDIDPNFSSNLFNHVILAIPTDKDTCFLECTSLTSPPNYLGNFTSNRYGLLVQDGKSKLIRTPSYRYSDNKIKIDAKGSIDVNGNLSLKLMNDYNGESASEWMHFKGSNSDKLIQYLELHEPLNNGIYKSAKIDECTLTPHCIQLRTDLIIYNALLNTTKRITIRPYYPDLPFPLTLLDTDRKNMIDVPTGYQINLSGEIKIPAYNEIEYLPEPVRIESPFGLYELKITIKEGHCLLDEQIEYLEGRYEREKVFDYNLFITKIKEARSAAIVLAR